MIRYLERRGAPAPAKLSAALERTGEELPRAVRDNTSQRVHGGQGPDGHTAVDNERCAPLAAFKPTSVMAGRGRTISRACIAEDDIAARVRNRCPGQGAVGQAGVGCLTERGLVAAVQEIEQNRGRHNRHMQIADHEAPPPLGQPPHHAVRRAEPEGRSAGEHDRIDRIHGALGAKKLELAGAGAATLHIDSGNRTHIRQHDGDPRPHHRVLGRTNGQPRHIRDRVPRTRLRHVSPRRSSSAVAAITLAETSMSSISTYSSGWCASSRIPGP